LCNSFPEADHSRTTSKGFSQPLYDVTLETINSNSGDSQKITCNIQPNTDRPYDTPPAARTTPTPEDTAGYSTPRAVGNDAPPRLHTTINTPGYLTPLSSQAEITTDDQRQLIIEENSPRKDETKA